MTDTAIALMPSWLGLSGFADLAVVPWDGGEPLPPPDVLERVVYFVPPYMCDISDVALGAQMPRLQVVQALMAGIDGMSEVLPPQVEVRRAVGVHDTSTAELAIGLMIAAQRGIDVAARDMLREQWNHVRRPSLADSAVAILGWGGVGQAIGRRLAAFDVSVTGFSRSGDSGSRPVRLFLDAPGSFDIVVLAVPLAPNAPPVLDGPLLARLKDDCLVVNVGRGRLIDTAALVQELAAGRLRAALDVTDPEPLPPGHPLWASPGVLITPHVGGDSAAFAPRARAMVERELRRFAAQFSG